MKNSVLINEETSLESISHWLGPDKALVFAKARLDKKQKDIETLIAALRKLQVNEFVNIQETIEKVDGIQTTTSEKKDE